MSDQFPAGGAPGQPPEQPAGSGASVPSASAPAGEQPQLPPAQGPQFPGTGAVLATPLLSADPPRISDYWLDARLAATASGVAYAAHDQDGTSVMLVVLAAGAASDAAARDRLAGEVNRMHLDTVVARGGQGQDEGRMEEKFVDKHEPYSPDGTAQAPWVALAYDGSPRAVAEANRLLTSIDLSRKRLIGTPAGPNYQMHWIENTQPGTTRLWPLPWPGRHDRAGWVSTLVAWLLTIMLAMMALLIAVLAFQNNPPSQAPPPIPPDSPSQQSPQSPQSSGGSPQSPESSDSQPQSPSSGDSSQSASPSPSSGSPSGEGSESGNPSASNRRLILDQGDRQRP